MLLKLFKKDSLITRIAIGKAVGFIIGLAAFLILPLMVSEISLMLRWGILLWYPTVGAFIGLVGVFNWHPILQLPMPWWFRASLVGAWMNLVLILFSYDQFRKISTDMFGADSMFVSPFWFVLEGALIGLVIGFLATRYGGEGKSILDNDQPPAEDSAEGQ